MSFNVKSRLADAVVEAALARPPGARHGFTGYWVASLRRVLDERVLRIATLNGHHFLLEAQIDPDATHVMRPDRMEEYVEHELLKHSKDKTALSIAAARARMKECITQGRIVVAFKNARPLAGPISSTGRNPVWYEPDA
jgi:hypothetical protein